MVDETLPKGVVALLRDGLVEAAPPDLSWTPGSSTMNLSLGERPVCLPVLTTSGPGCGEQALFALDGLLVQGGDGQVCVAGAAEQRDIARNLLAAWLLEGVD